MLENDVLFSQGDRAEEVYFIFHGAVLLYIDLSEVLNMKMYVKSEETFNMPLCMYQYGAYFGDSDVLNNVTGYRSHTCVIHEDS